MRRVPLSSCALLALAVTLAVTAPLAAQRDLDAVEIQTQKVADGIFMLVGAGGNLGVSAGADGAFLIDDQFAPLTAKIQAAVEALGHGGVRFVLNTHWHFDHTGGNENLGQAGALIVAHDNVRKRMSTEQFIKALGMQFEPSPAAALPVVTFTDRVTFHINGDTVHAYHVPPAHTDGDSIVRFESANVVHMGDVYFHRMYPFIDIESGGSVDGVIAAVRGVIDASDDATKIIPGHGPLSNRAELIAYRDMLQAVRDEVARLIADGKDRDAVIAAKPSATWDEALGGGFRSPADFVGSIYDSLTE